MPLPNLGNQNNQGRLPPVPKKGGGLPRMGELPPPKAFAPSMSNNTTPSDDVFSQLPSGLPTDEPLLEESISYEREKEIPTIEQTKELPSEDNPFMDPDEKETEYIDYEKEKIQPIGGKRAKIKDKDLDVRKNKLFSLKLARLFVYLAIIGVFALGIKNTWFPTQIYTNEEIEWLALSAIGDTGFPLVEGRSYATAYIYHYLNTNTEHSVLLNTISNKDNRIIPIIKEEQKQDDKKFWGQFPITEPILVEEIPLTESSAIYTFKALITNSGGEIVQKQNGGVTIPTAHWESFAIQIYYQKTKEMFSVIEAPTLVSVKPIKNIDIPEANKLGTGEEDKESGVLMDSTIKGFIKAFLSVSVDNHAEIDQYIPANPSPHLTQGFGGAYKLNKDDDIKYKVFKTEDSNIWKVETILNLTSANVTPQESGVTYTSQHYVLTIEKTDKDVYLVTKIAPYWFIIEENTEK